MSITLDDVKLIVNNYFQENLYEKISKDYINHYNSPSFLISLILYLRDIKKDLSKFKIEEFLQEIIKNRDYITNSFIKDNLKIFIE